MSVPALRFKDDDGRDFPKWGLKLLGEFATFAKGKGISKADINVEGLTPCIRYGELYTEYGETIREIKSKTNIDIKNLVLSELNDVIIPASGETQIDIAKASCVQLAGVALGGDLIIIKSHENGVFISYYLNSQKKLDIAKLAQGNSVVHLYSSQLKKLSINLPLKAEQTKIANFLTAVDEKIQHITQKSDLLAQYKKGVMQQIFSQELRFKDDDGGEFPAWETRLLKDVLLKNSTKNKKSEFSLVQSVSNKHGFINQNELFENRVIASTDLSNYYVIKKGAFAYNPSRIDVGSLAYQGDDLTSVVSPLYVSFYAVPLLIVDLFLFNWFESEQFTSQMNSSFEGSVRNTLSYESLSRISFALPCLNEQTKIAYFLTAIDDKIIHTQTQLAAVKEYKQGLLQQMFV